MNIGLVTYPGCVASGLFAFAELLDVANKRSGKQHFTLSWVGLDKQDVLIRSGNTNSSIKLLMQTTLKDKNLDALLLPGFWTNHQEHTNIALGRYKNLIDELRDFPSDKVIWSYCTAVCLMAETGKLDGLTATSTWWLADYLEEKYPTVHWNFNQSCIFTQHGASASGVNGYLPIAQELIKTHCGDETLRDIVDLMILPKPDSSQQPFKNIKLMKLEDQLLRKIFVWVEQTPATELKISSLAKSLHLTERTLARRVKALTQNSCAAFIRLIKLHQAGEYLIYSSQSINAISNKLGFSNDSSFRRLFKQVSSYTPSAYRLAFKR